MAAVLTADRIYPIGGGGLLFVTLGLGLTIGVIAHDVFICWFTENGSGSKSRVQNYEASGARMNEWDVWPISEVISGILVLILAGKV
ncbi:conserved hypothetical protein [Ricinus communis]|uniref:Uncharacterized protein n=1 Tax=Ricinus communis TaxID=3988 RepID=B9RVQ6_RICCO|nr:conserved hypothetical protein [Ricinus communis]